LKLSAANKKLTSGDIHEMSANLDEENCLAKVLTGFLRVVFWFLETLYAK
jgi:hypothetical protein